MSENLTDLKKLQIVEIDILDEIVEICDKYNLKYYLNGGTLLGAIRHKGFIPWDDDVDIWMFREDYDKFAEIAPKELKKEYFYQSWITDPEYPYNFAKVRMNGTVFHEKKTSHLNINQGIWVDIFPLDKEPVDITDSKMSKFHKRATLIRLLIEVPPLYVIYKNPIKKALAFFANIVFSKKLLHKLLLKMETKYNNTDSNIYSYRMAPKLFEFNIEDFVGDKKAMFEGREYSIPNDYDKILTMLFGDYMQLPPVEQRVTNHPTDMFDFGDYFKEK